LHCPSCLGNQPSNISSTNHHPLQTPVSDDAGAVHLLCRFYCAHEGQDWVGGLRQYEAPQRQAHTSSHQLVARWRRADDKLLRLVARWRRANDKLLRLVARRQAEVMLLGGVEQTTGSEIGLLRGGGWRNTTGQAMLSIKMTTYPPPTGGSRLPPHARKSASRRRGRTGGEHGAACAWRESLGLTHGARRAPTQGDVLRDSLEHLVSHGPPTGKCHRMPTLTSTVSAGGGLVSKLL
jgi:hypothetical protein